MSLLDSKATANTAFELDKHTIAVPFSPAIKASPLFTTPVTLTGTRPFNAIYVPPSSSLFIIYAGLAETTPIARLPTVQAVTSASPPITTTVPVS